MPCGTSLKGFTPNHTAGVTPPPRWAQPGNGLPGEQGRGLGGEVGYGYHTEVPGIKRAWHPAGQEHLTGLHHRTTLELGQWPAVGGLEHRAVGHAVDRQYVLLMTNTVPR